MLTIYSETDDKHGLLNPDWGAPPPQPDSKGHTPGFKIGTHKLTDAVTVPTSTNFTQQTVKGKWAAFIKHHTWSITVLKAGIHLGRILQRILQNSVKCECMFFTWTCGKPDLSRLNFLFHWQMTKSHVKVHMHVTLTESLVINIFSRMSYLYRFITKSVDKVSDRIHHSYYCCLRTPWKACSSQSKARSSHWRHFTKKTLLCDFK